jgi:zinc-ribbon domain
MAPDTNGADVFCTECGAALPADAKFCRSCGHPATATTTPPTATQPRPITPPAPAPPRRRRRWPWLIAVVGAVIIIVVVAGHNSSSPSSTLAGSQAAPQSEKEARTWIKEHREDAKRVAVNLEVVEIDVGELQKEETPAKVDELAQSAQKAHNNIDEVRQEFATGSYSGEVEKAAVQVFTSANSLKNAMGALVAYTGNPNPATLAHFTTQYTPAKEEWDEGITSIWRLARESSAPTLEPAANENATSTAATPSGANEPLEALKRYWDDIGSHDFSGAYGYLAPGAVSLNESEFVSSEERAGIQHVEFHGQAKEGSSSTTSATIEVVSLITHDTQFGCRVWSGSYQMTDESGSWHIEKASLTPRPCG